MHSSSAMKTPAERLAFYRRLIEARGYGSVAEEVVCFARLSSSQAAQRRIRQEWHQRQWRKQKRSRETVAKLRPKVLQADVCFYCNRRRPTVVDHIVPLSDGGRNQPWNLAPACRSCNSKKGDYTVRGFSSRRLLQMLRAGDDSVILAVFGSRDREEY